MYMHLLLGAITCFAGWLYLRWLKIKRYWADRRVPHLPPVPILGSLTFIQRENIGLWLRKMQQHFKSPYIGIWFFWRPGLIINSPEIAYNILIKDFDNFRNRFVSSGTSDPIGRLNLYTVNDPVWLMMRQHLNSVFTPKKIKMLQDYTRTKAKELVQRIYNDRKVKINLKKMYVDYTTDVTGTSAFGVKSDATLTGVGSLRDITNDFSKYSICRGLPIFSIHFLPELVDFFRFKFFPKTSTESFRKIFRAACQQKINLKDGEAKNLLEILVQFQKKNESYSDDLIIAQAVIFLFAGYEGAGNILTFITYELAHNPELQEKLYQELSEAAEHNGSEDFDIEVLSELVYLDCVIKEGLRKYATLSWLDRITAKDYKIDDKLTIEAGTIIYINVSGIHHDSKYFPEPHKFDPDRFLPENKNEIEPYSYLPFGEGPRACIGKTFGLMTTQFALASVLLNYKLQPRPNMPKPADIKIDNRIPFFSPGETLHVKFIPRGKC